MFLLFLITLILSFCNVPSNAKSSSSFYDILEVSKGCTSAELKKAYRKQCLKTHPDKGGDEDTFKQVQKAYDVLSDDNKRKMYDQFGESAVDGDTPVPPQAAQQPGFGGGPTFFPFGQSSSPSSGRTGWSFEKESSNFNFGGIDFEELLRGATSQNPNSGGFNLDASEFLRQMMNHHHQQQQQQGGRASSRTGGTNPFGQQQQQYAPRPPPKPVTQTCWCSLEDLSVGSTKKMKVYFPAAYTGQHSKTPPRSRVYTIQLQKGWKAGTKVKFDASKDGRFSPITFVIQEKKHPIFQRRGDDLIYRHDLNSSLERMNATTDPIPTSSYFSSTAADAAAAAGGTNTSSNNSTTVKLELVLPDGEIWTRSIPKKSSFLRNGQTLTITGKGMPIKGGPKRGNLIIEFYDSSASAFKGSSDGSSQQQQQQQQQHSFEGKAKHQHS